MAVTPAEVVATAALARLDLACGLTPETAEHSIARLAEQMATIIDYMDILNQADTTGIEPLYSPMQQVAPPREDVATQRLTVDAVLQNAPRRHDAFFVVPPVI